MSVYKIVFSPTGGTGRVADRLARALGAAGEVKTIDLCDRNARFEEYELRAQDVCVVAVPAYVGRVPAAAAERLARLRGNGARAVAAAVFGNRDFDDTLLELRDVLNAAGFVCAAGVAAVAEHSIMRRYGAGRPDAADLAELDAFSGRIAEKLAGETVREPELPGNRPYRAWHDLPIKPKAGKGCAGCGLCTEKCPVGAIPAGEPQRTDAKKCISCMRCIAVCPAGARGVSPLLLAASEQNLKKACSARKENRLFL